MSSTNVFTLCMAPALSSPATAPKPPKCQETAALSTGPLFGDHIPDVLLLMSARNGTTKRKLPLDPSEKCQSIGYHHPPAKRMRSETHQPVQTLCNRTEATSTTSHDPWHTYSRPSLGDLDARGSPYCSYIPVACVGHPCPAPNMPLPNALTTLIDGDLDGISGALRELILWCALALADDSVPIAHESTCAYLALCVARAAIGTPDRESWQIQPSSPTRTHLPAWIEAEFERGQHLLVPRHCTLLAGRRDAILTNAVEPWATPGVLAHIACLAARDA